MKQHLLHNGLPAILAALLLLGGCPNPNSDDGSTKLAKLASNFKWTKETDRWSPRFYHTSVVFNNKIWVMGGRDAGGIFGGLPPFRYNNTHDVWSSSDGMKWVLETGVPDWESRRSHSSVVFKDKIWILGGTIATGSRKNDGTIIVGKRKNDVWSSPDGKDWTRVTAAAPWSPRTSHVSVVSNGKIWVLGGYESPPVKSLNDVWSSPDGKTWTQVTAAAPWSPRGNHVSVVFNSKIWIMGGGHNYKYTSKGVWSSPDGKTWTRETTAPWLPRQTPKALVYNGKIWVLGGWKDGHRSDVWSSADGKDWTQVTAAAPWPIRYAHTGVVFKDKIWILGGGHRGGFYNDVWSFSVSR